MGIQQMLLGSKVGIAAPPPGWNTYEAGATFGPAEVLFTFYNDGRLIVTNQTSFQLANTRWYTPITTGIGASYWWKAAFVSGVNPPYSSSLTSNVTRGGEPSLNTWYNLSPGRVISFGADGTANTGLVSGEHVVYISTTANDADIVATWPIRWAVEVAI